MKKVTAIVGVPRSGTSATSNVCLNILGEENLIGSKFMGNETDSPKIWQGAFRESTPIQEYNQKKLDERSRFVLAPLDRKKRIREMKDMNKKGFYECPFTVNGLSWSNRTDDLFKKMERLERPFMKLVCSGIAKTNPELIEKIVYVLRCPHEVAKSQEKLKGRKLPDGEVIHSPEFFIKATVQFCRWYVNFGSDIPLLMVHHRDLMTDPEAQTKRIAEFHGLPHNNSWKIIDKNLYRSKHEPVENNLWEDAEHIFDLMQKSDFEGVISYIDNPDIMTHKANKAFMCHRIGRKVTMNECNNCKTNDTVIANFIITAEKKKIQWEKEPCAFDCGAIDRNTAITIDQSIKNNHWLFEKGKIGDMVKSFVETLGVDKVFGKCKECVKRQDNWNFLFKIKKKLL